MPTLSTRPGTGLAELVVALTLAGVIMAAAGGTLAQHLRRQRARDDQRTASAIVGTVRDVLREEVARADPALTLLGDTAVQLAAERLSAPACDVSGARVYIDAAAAAWSAPRSGDSLAVLDTLTGQEWRTSVVSVGSQHGTAACPSGAIRLLLAAPPPASVPLARLPMRVWRTARYVTYRASDRTWWLGERTCAPVCGSAQPIAGPIRSPAEGGLKFAPVIGVGGRLVALDVAVRAVAGARAESLFARVPVAAR